MLKAVRFRVQNFRNIDDSGWIPLERVTNFVGRNESGKTTLLKAFHKFNPATPEPYDPQREFPRDRYTRDYVAGGSKGGEWPVCSVAFAIPDDAKKEIAGILGKGNGPPSEAILTRYYDGSLSIAYEPALQDQPLSSEPVVKALAAFSSAARRLAAPAPEQEEATAAQRTALATWATGWQDKLRGVADLCDANGATLLGTLLSEAEGKSNPQTADMVEALQEALSPVLDSAKAGPVIDRVDELIEARLPVLIYFENYGILDSAIWLPRFLEDQKRTPTDARVQTINAMFRHVGLDSKEITELGNEEAQNQRRQGISRPPRCSQTTNAARKSGRSGSIRHR